MDESKVRLRTLDVFMGVGFLAVGAFVAYDGVVAYYAPQLVTVEKSSNPGVTTIFIGGLMGFLGLVIAIMTVMDMMIRPAICFSTLCVSIRNTGRETSKPN